MKDRLTAQKREGAERHRREGAGHGKGLVERRLDHQGEDSWLCAMRGSIGRHPCQRALGVAGQDQVPAGPAEAIDRLEGGHAFGAVARAREADQERGLTRVEVALHRLDEVRGVDASRDPAGARRDLGRHDPAREARRPRPGQDDREVQLGQRSREEAVELGGPRAQERREAPPHLGLARDLPRGHLGARCPQVVGRKAKEHPVMGHEPPVPERPARCPPGPHRRGWRSASARWLG